MNTSARSPADARIAGAIYLVVILTGMFCLAWVPGQLGTGIAATAAQEGLFRAGIAAFVVMQIAFLLLPLALYRVLEDVNPALAKLMVALAVVSVPIGLIAVTHRMEALALLPTTGLSPSAGDEQAFALCMQRYALGLRMASLFWGLWLLPFGWLVLRSGRLPRVLGVLLLLGGLGYVLRMFGGLAPDFAKLPVADYLTLPAALGEIGSGLWLLLIGARYGAARSVSVTQ